MGSNLAYQDDFIAKRREELIDGKPVMMSPRPTVNHNHVVLNISRLFSNYLYGKRCTPFSDGVDLFLDEENRFVPDFMVVCDPDKIKLDGVHGAPDLVVEVLSPGTAKNDKTRKKDVYARCGVREYWLVGPEDKSIEVYHLDGESFLLHDIYTLHADWQLAQMSEEERSALVTHFKCSLFDDLDISIDDIFYRTF
jgi:Uma2 family endonuclease